MRSRSTFITFSGAPAEVRAARDLHAAPPRAAGNKLDRLEQLREKPEWVQSAVTAPNALFLPFFRLAPLVALSADGRQGQLKLLPREQLPSDALKEPVLLGRKQEHTLWAVDVKDASFFSADKAARFLDLRKVIGSLTAEEGAVTAQVLTTCTRALRSFPLMRLLANRAARSLSGTRRIGGHLRQRGTQSALTPCLRCPLPAAQVLRCLRQPVGAPCSWRASPLHGCEQGASARGNAR